MGENIFNKNFRRICCKLIENSGFGQKSNFTCSLQVNTKNYSFQFNQYKIATTNFLNFVYSNVY